MYHTKTEPDYSIADLVHAYTGEDINGLDATDYRQLVSFVKMHTTEEERSYFFATGQLLHPRDEPTKEDQ